MGKIGKYPRCLYNYKSGQFIKLWTENIFPAVSELYILMTGGFPVLAPDGSFDVFFTESLNQLLNHNTGKSVAWNLTG